MAAVEITAQESSQGESDLCRCRGPRRSRRSLVTTGRGSRDSDPLSIITGIIWTLRNVQANVASSTGPCTWQGAVSTCAYH